MSGLFVVMALLSSNVVSCEMHNPLSSAVRLSNMSLSASSSAFPFTLRRRFSRGSFPLARAPRHRSTVGTRVIRSVGFGSPNRFVSDRESSARFPGRPPRLAHDYGGDPPMWLRANFQRSGTDRPCLERATTASRHPGDVVDQVPLLLFETPPPPENRHSTRPGP